MGTVILLQQHIDNGEVLPKWHHRSSFLVVSMTVISPLSSQFNSPMSIALVAYAIFKKEHITQRHYTTLQNCNSHKTVFKNRRKISILTFYLFITAEANDFDMRLNSKVKIKMYSSDNTNTGRWNQSDFNVAGQRFVEADTETRSRLRMHPRGKQRQ